MCLPRSYLDQEANPSFSSQATRNSLPDSFDVGLTYDWSQDISDVESTRSRLAHPYASPNPSLTSKPPVKEDPNLALSSKWTPFSGSDTLADLDSPFSTIRKDLLHEPLSALMSPTPAAVFPSVYGRKLPTFLYKTESAPSVSSQAFRYQTPLTSPRVPSLALPPSPTSSTRTRPLFLPSPSIAPLQLEKTYTDDTSTRKRKGRRSSSFDAPISRPKRHRADSDVVDVEDDPESDDDWIPPPIDTGYQTLRTPNFSIERTPAFDADCSAMDSEVFDSDEKSWITTNRYSHVSQTPAPPQAANIWLGPEGGAIKFKSKPPNFDEKAFSRWSYAMTGPRLSTVSERTDGDIHFSPSDGLGTNEPYKYWGSKYGVSDAKAGCSRMRAKYLGITSPVFSAFITGFNTASPLMSMLDVGVGKEAADAKIRVDPPLTTLPDVPF
ncbi:hypothetical protein RSAG8_13322, partial [Rhizoctonia solani AG-8 WAC10335]